MVRRSVTEIINEYSKYLHPKQFSSSGGLGTPIVLFDVGINVPNVIFSDFSLN